MREWLNVVEFEGEPGGAFVTEHDGADDRAEDRILSIEPPRLLEHTWWEEMNPDGVVRWTLDPHPDGCRLTLTYAAPPECSDDWARDMAGWHTMIELLASYLDGVPVGEHQRPSKDSDGGRSGEREFTRSSRRSTPDTRKSFPGPAGKRRESRSRESHG